MPELNQKPRPPHPEVYNLIDNLIDTAQRYTGVLRPAEILGALACVQQMLGAMYGVTPAENITILQKLSETTTLNMLNIPGTPP
jgi:hypothetical protein